MNCVPTTYSFEPVLLHVVRHQLNPADRASADLIPGTSTTESVLLEEIYERRAGERDGVQWDVIRA